VDDPTQLQRNPALIAAQRANLGDQARRKLKSTIAKYTLAGAIWLLVAAVALILALTRAPSYLFMAVGSALAGVMFLYTAQKQRAMLAQAEAAEARWAAEGKPSAQPMPPGQPG